MVSHLLTTIVYHSPQLPDGGRFLSSFNALHHLTELRISSLNIEWTHASDGDTNWGLFGSPLSTVKHLELTNFNAHCHYPAETGVDDYQFMASNFYARLSALLAAMFPNIERLVIEGSLVEGSDSLVAQLRPHLVRHAPRLREVVSMRQLLDRYRVGKRDLRIQTL